MLYPGRERKKKKKKSSDGDGGGGLRRKRRRGVDGTVMKREIGWDERGQTSEASLCCCRVQPFLLQFSYPRSGLGNVNQLTHSSSLFRLIKIF